MTMDIKVERGVQRQTLFKKLCGRYLRRAVVGILRVASEVVKDAYAAKFDIEGVEDEEGKA